MRSRKPVIQSSNTGTSASTITETKWHKRLVSEKSWGVRTFWNIISFFGRVLTLGKWNPLPAITSSVAATTRRDASESNSDKILLETSNKSEIAPRPSIKTYSTDHHIFVKTLTGKTVTLDFDADEPIEKFRQKVELALIKVCDKFADNRDSLEKFDTDDRTTRNPNLIFAGKRLEDGCTLRDYNIQEESFIHQVLRLN